MLYEPNSDFDFNKVILGAPNGLQGGSYFTKLLVNNNPLYLQIPKCNLKQGLVVTEKKKYCDLMFSHDDTKVIEWFEQIERKAQELMFEKKDIWFHEDLEFSDIENAFTSPIRSYKSGRFYLVRCMFPKVINSDTISCYNENEEPIPIDTLNEKNVEIIPLIEVQGVKFSSKNFQIEIGMKQIMVIKKDAIFKNCMIKIQKPQSEKSESEKLEPEKLEPEKSELTDVNSVADANTVADVNSVADANRVADIDTVTDANSVADVDTVADVNSVADGNSVADVNSVADGNSVADVDTVADANSVANVNSVADDNTVAVVDTVTDATDAEKVENTENEDMFATTNINNEEPKIELSVKDKDLEENGELEEVNLTVDDTNEPLVLKQPNEVYYTMWRSARQKAKLAKKEAIAAYLEAKKIKENYMLDGIDSDSDYDEEEYHQEAN
jgi:hypothetical protein